MKTNNELKEFFKNNKIGVILDNKISFKHKLHLTKDDYEYLNNAKNLKEFTEILIAGIAGAGVVYGGFMASLGVLGQIGLGLGLVSLPVSGMILGAGAAMATVFGFKKIFNTAENKFYDKLPKYLQTPLDVLAESLADLFIPIFIKISLIDGTFSKEEKNFIIDYLTIQWGYNKNYIESKIEEYYKKVDKFKLSNVNKYIEKISKTTKGLNEFYIKEEIQNMCEKLIKLDNNYINEKKKYLQQIL